MAKTEDERQAVWANPVTEASEDDINEAITGILDVRGHLLVNHVRDCAIDLMFPVLDDSHGVIHLIIAPVNGRSFTLGRICVGRCRCSIDAGIIAIIIVQIR